MDDDDALRTELADYERVFNLMWAADKRAIERWQQAHPGNDLVWPDRLKLTEWLLSEIDRLTVHH